jgi:signal peptidase II
MRTKMKNIYNTGLFWLWIAVLIFVLDRYTKIWALHHLVMYEPLKIFSFFNLTLAFNTGAAFSFLHTASGWQHWFLGGLACVVSLVILYWLYQLPVRAWFLSVALCLTIGGALGNLWDRVTYAHVIDFLDFHIGSWHWPIFNIADSGICVGAGMMFWYWWRCR